MGARWSIGSDPNDMRNLHPAAASRYTNPGFDRSRRRADTTTRLVGQRVSSRHAALTAAEGKYPIYYQHVSCGNPADYRRVENRAQFERVLPQHFWSDHGVIRQVFTLGPMPEPRPRMQEPACERAPRPSFLFDRI